MTKAYLAITFLVTCLSAGISQEASLPPGAEHTLRERQKAMLDIFSNGDPDGFRQIAGDDYRTINADGTYMDREETAQIISKFKGSRSEIVSQEDRFYGPVAISTGRIKFYVGSVLMADVYATQIWIYRNDRWEYIGWHGTMTGTPKNYPLYAVGILLILVLMIYWLVRVLRRRRQAHRTSGTA